MDARCCCAAEDAIERLAFKSSQSRHDLVTTTCGPYIDGGKILQGGIGLYG